MVIAHRGYDRKLSTIRSFNRAFKSGAEAIECDLRLTKDNEVIVCHDKVLKVEGKRIKVSHTTFPQLKALCNGACPLTLDELLDFMKAQKAPVFLEVKTSSRILIDSISEKVQKRKMWPLVYVIGFSIFIRTALKLQTTYPKMRVLQFVNFPRYSYIRKPKKSYGVFVGWLGGLLYPSRWLFKAFVSPRRLTKLHQYYKKHGFKVMGGVINNKKGFEIFKKAGISDIVTDNVSEASLFFKG